MDNKSEKFIQKKIGENLNEKLLFFERKPKLIVIIFLLFLFIMNSAFAKDQYSKKPVILNSSLQIFELFLKDVKLDRKLNGKIETKFVVYELGIRMGYDKSFIDKDHICLYLNVGYIDNKKKHIKREKQYVICQNTISKEHEKFYKLKEIKPLIVENFNTLVWNINIFKELEMFEFGGYFNNYNGKNIFDLDSCNNLNTLNVDGDALVLFKASNHFDNPKGYVDFYNYVEDIKGIHIRASAEIVKEIIRHSKAQRFSSLTISEQITKAPPKDDTTTIPLKSIDYFRISLKPLSSATINNSFINKVFAPFKIDYVEDLRIDCGEFLDTLSINLNFIKTIKKNIIIENQHQLLNLTYGYDEFNQLLKKSSLMMSSGQELPIFITGSVMNIIINNLSNTPKIQFNSRSFEFNFPKNAFQGIDKCYYIPVRYNLIANSKQAFFYSSKKNFGMSSEWENLEMAKHLAYSTREGINVNLLDKPFFGYQSDETGGNHLRAIVIIKTPEELIQEKKQLEIEKERKRIEAEKKRIEAEKKRIEAEKRRIEAEILLKKQKEARDSLERLEIEKLEYERKIGGVVLSNGIILKNIKLPNDFKFRIIQNNVELCDWCKSNRKEYQIASTQEQINLMLYRIASASWGSLCCEANQRGLSPKNLPYSEDLSKINKFIDWYVQKFGYTKEQLTLFAYTNSTHIIPYVYETLWSWANISPYYLNQACNLNQQENNNLLINLKTNWTLDLLMKLPANKYIYTSKYCSPRCEKEANRK